MSGEHKTIGELNGKWGIMFKLTVAFGAFSLPFLIALNVWFVKAIYELKLQQAEIAIQMQSFIAVGPRYTPEMARSDNLELMNEIMEKIQEQYPPQWLTKEVESHSRRLEFVEKGLNEAHNKRD